MTNRERLQLLDPVDRYRFLKNTLLDNRDLPKGEIRDLLSSEDAEVGGYFIWSKTEQGWNYWRERVIIMMNA